MMDKIVATIGVMCSVILLQSQDVDYINIKNPSQIPFNREIEKDTKLKEKSKKESQNKSEDVILNEIIRNDTCELYKIVDAYKCKDCFKFVLEEEKSWHDSSHKLESIKLGIRYKCSKCGRMFVGDSATFCPKCKGKLKKELIEVVEIENEGQKYFINKKTDEKVCFFKQKDNVKNEKVK